MKRDDLIAGNVGGRTQHERATENPSSFRFWQPAYSERGIATFPVSMKHGQKKPAIIGWQRIGLPGSAKLARQFPDADAFGLCPGSRSRLTILDIDTTDERVLSDALARHGKTPIIARTGSGHYQAWYQNNGEIRRIRPFAGKPIDVLGAGFVVVPPSRGSKLSYQFIEGGLDDIDRLPPMRGLVGPSTLLSVGQVNIGARNQTLFALCMRAAHRCDDFDGLLDVARTRNAELLPPLSDDEVAKVATSAWGYTQRGENQFGTRGAFFPAVEANHLIATDQDALLLLLFLRANNGPRSTFLVANTLAIKLGWTRKRIAAARKSLECSYLKQIRRASKGLPGLFCWAGKGGQN